MRAIRTICSINWDKAAGFIFCLPWKYPLMTDEIAMMGTTGAMANKGRRVLESVNSVSANIGAVNSRIGVKMAERVIVVANETTSIFLIFAVSPMASASATFLDIATGRPKLCNGYDKDKGWECHHIKTNTLFTNKAGNDNAIDKS